MFSQLSRIQSLFKLVQTPLVGMDVGSSTIKLLELSCNQGTYQVEAYANTSIPSSDTPASPIQEAVFDVVRKATTQRKFAALCISGPTVITRVFQVNANFTDEEIVEQLELEADHYIPYPLEEVLYDFYIDRNAEDHSNLSEVVLVAARRECVESCLDALSLSGLKASILDVDRFVMERAFKLILNQLGEQAIVQNTAVIDLGASVTTLHIFKNARSIYARDQTFGVKQLMNEIERRYGLSNRDAMDLVKYGGLPEDYHDEILQPFKEVVTRQISHALQIFFSSSEESAIQSLVLAGGGACLSGLGEYVEEKMGIKTCIANPFAEMQISSNLDKNRVMEEAPALMKSVGLALRNF